MSFIQARALDTSTDDAGHYTQERTAFCVSTTFLIALVPRYALFSCCVCPQRDVSTRLKDLKDRATLWTSRDMDLRRKLVQQVNQVFPYLSERDIDQQFLASSRNKKAYTPREERPARVSDL